MLYREPQHSLPLRRPTQGIDATAKKFFVLRRNPGVGVEWQCLSFSVVSGARPGALPTQNLAAIAVLVPVLLRRKDASPVCDPQGVPAILRA